MSIALGVKSAKLTINPQDQNLETINRIVSGVLGRSGCRTCGRMIQLDIAFASDPDPDLANEGVLAVQTEGF